MLLGGPSALALLQVSIDSVGDCSTSLTARSSTGNSTGDCSYVAHVECDDTRRSNKGLVMRRKWLCLMDVVGDNSYADHATLAVKITKRTMMQQDSSTSGPQSILI